MCGPHNLAIFARHPLTPMYPPMLGKALAWALPPIFPRLGAEVGSRVCPLPLSTSRPAPGFSHLSRICPPLHPWGPGPQISCPNPCPTISNLHVFKVQPLNTRLPPRSLRVWLLRRSSLTWGRVEGRVPGSPTQQQRPSRGLDLEVSEGLWSQQVRTREAGVTSRGCTGAAKLT